MAKQRVEYIGAMRGFLTILVAYSHICSNNSGAKWIGRMMCSSCIVYRISFFVSRSFWRVI